MVSSVSESSNKVAALFQFIAVSVVAGVVGAGLAIPSVGVASMGADAGVELFSALPAELDERPLAEQSRMLASDGSEIATFYWQNRKEVSLEDVSEQMQQATVAVEDERFFEHGGVDLQGIARAVVYNLLSDDTQGGSTLTQQYVKNVLSENANAEDESNRAAIEEATESSGAAGYARKLREAKLAAAVENKYSKHEILNRYLNINNYSGTPRVYGVEAAAQRYWGISAKDLNIQQSATLAGIVKNPAAFNPQTKPENAIERRNTVLGLMHKQGKITQEEYDEARNSDLELDIHETPNGCAAAGNKGYFCDYVQRVVENDPIFGETKEERRNLLQRGGLTIKTTLDPKMQNEADKAVKKRVPVGDPSGAGHTIVSVEPGSGKVLSMAQNRNYTASEGKKGSDTQINFNVDNSHNGANGFQVGSTWKPFVLTEWLKEGKTLGSTVNATKREYAAGSWKYRGCDNNGAKWNPNNAGDGGGNSAMTALDATRKSVNTGYAAMANQLDMCGIMKTATDLGIKYGNGSPLDTKLQDGTTDALKPASVLGIVQVAPIDMASAYAVYASGGTYCRPTPITEITDSEGEKVDVPKADCKKVLDKKVADSVAWALSQTFNGGTTSSLRIGAPAGAKTGTTNFEVGSTWLVGFTRKISTAVWTGHPDKNMDWRKNSKGKVRGRIYGATISGQTWQSYMSKAIKETKGNTGFSRPSGTQPESSTKSGGSRSGNNGGGNRGGGSSNNNGGGGGGNNGGGGGGNNGGDDGGGNNGGDDGGGDEPPSLGG
ncbi:transglycosylase domain-containing protein [Brevibacterium luteolum]|uniref:transglycosylase domain-containing protein n=2 Tax=Brevibacterium TaxID=1696 RepID=UPI00223C0953|nr:transglycosylase domain-containing protein [Brevibacterium luteolum]MCT1828681.1 penicillin-binding protein [Brevibacterium luteolum]